MVIDSGVFIASSFTDELSSQAKGLLKQLAEANAVLHVPVLFRNELVAACRKLVYQKRISARAARLHLHNMLSANLTVHYNDILLKRAYKLAEEYDLPSAYESQYLALAEQLSCEFWTTDKCLFDAASCGFPNMRWLGDWHLDS